MRQPSAANTSHGRFAWYFEAAPEAIPEARHAFEAWLAASTSDADEVADMAVVLSELASNALSGADGTERGIQIHASIEGAELVLEVVNEVPSHVGHVARWDLDDPLRGGGRGLMIVRAYTDTLEIDSAGKTVTVRCTRRLEGQ